MSMMPLGSIIAWIPKPKADSNSYSNAVLPDGWLECSYNQIKKGPWKGLYTPDLNKEHRFLRGGLLDDVLKEQTHTVEDLNLKIIDPGHIHTMNKHTHSYTYYTYPNEGSIFGAATTAHENPDKKYGTTGGTRSTMQSAKSNIRITSSYSTDSDDETRPINTSIIWIMRVF